MDQQNYQRLKDDYYKIVDPNIEGIYKCKLIDVNMLNVLSASAPIKEGNVIILNDFDGKFKVKSREGNTVSLEHIK